MRTSTEWPVGIDRTQMRGCIQIFRAVLGSLKGTVGNHIVAVPKTNKTPDIFMSDAETERILQGDR